MQMQILVNIISLHKIVTKAPLYPNDGNVVNVNVIHGNPYIFCLIAQVGKYALTRLGLQGPLLPSKIS